MATTVTDIEPVQPDTAAAEDPVVLTDGVTVDESENKTSKITANDVPVPVIATEIPEISGVSMKCEISEVSSVSNTQSIDAIAVSPQALKSTSAEIDNSNIITSSENINNENREKELRLTNEAASVSSNPSDEQPSTTAEDEYSKHITYNDKGVAIYTDPSTSDQYQFDDTKNDWVPVTDENRIASTGSAAADPYENEHYRWCHETNQWIAKQITPADEVVTENEFYKFDSIKKEWIPKASSNVVTTITTPDGDQHTYTDADGVVFFWDSTKNAWFPKIDDDFMAKYQMGYGNYDASKDEKEKLQAEDVADELKEKAVTAVLKRKAQPEQPQWFDLPAEQNTKVYVSNLPTDITEEEFIEIMSKYGMIFRDPVSNKMKIKLYSEPDGQLKGDGLCDYIRVESVEMALKLLDGSDLRGKKVKVEPAKFQMRGEYNPALKPKKKKKDKDKIKKMQEKLFDWRPEKMRGERSKHERIVIIKNLFVPELFEEEVHLIIDYQKDLREECTKCGTVRKVIVYDRHPEGVAQINMADPDEADLVVQMMHKRFFGKRQLEAHIWDGKTKYKVEETKVEEQKRLSNWDNFLITGEEDESKKTSKIPDSNAPTDVSSEVGKAENVADDVDNDDDYFDDGDKDDSDFLENKLDKVE